MESLNKGVFERCTSTGREFFFILNQLDTAKFVFLSVFTIIETICPKSWAKPLSKIEKKWPLPVDVRRSKTCLNSLVTSLNSPLMLSSSLCSSVTSFLFSSLSAAGLASSPFSCLALSLSSSLAFSLAANETRGVL